MKLKNLDTILIILIYAIVDIIVIVMLKQTSISRTDKNYENMNNSVNAIYNTSSTNVDSISSKSDNSDKKYYTSKDYEELIYSKLDNNANIKLYEVTDVWWDGDENSIEIFKEKFGSCSGFQYFRCVYNNKWVIGKVFINIGDYKIYYYNENKIIEFKNSDDFINQFILDSKF